MEKTLDALLSEGHDLRVTIRSGWLGCADAQNACAEYGYLLLHQRGDSYLIDTPDDENIVFVDSLDYIKLIVATWEVL